MLRAVMVTMLEMLTEILEKKVGNRHLWTGLPAEVVEHGDIIIDICRFSVQHFFSMG